ncbi:MAG: tetratricopeptide repeat protein [Cyanobacteria bacterium P01_G01_bin.38]
MTELVDFWIWVVVVLIILGIGGSSLVITTLRPLGRQIPFPAPIADLSLLISNTAQSTYQAGIKSYQAGRYDAAIDRFNQLIQQEPNCPEGYHNRGLAQANLGKTNLAVNDLLKAGELYDQQGTKDGIDVVKGQLETLSQRVKG